MRLNKESFLPGFNRATAALAHGGQRALGRRKSYRPIDPKQALHVVLRSSIARGKRSMLHPAHCDQIHGFTQKVALRWGIRVYRYANVGNHIHLLIRVPSRASWQRFLKELAGGIAIIMTGAKKGAALDKNQAQRGFWDHLAFTRIVSFGRDYAGVARYLVKNVFEGAGVPMKRLLAQGLRVMTIARDGSLSGAPP